MSTSSFVKSMGLRHIRVTARWRLHYNIHVASDADATFTAQIQQCVVNQELKCGQIAGDQELLNSGRIIGTEVTG